MEALRGIWLLREGGAKRQNARTGVHPITVYRGTRSQRPCQALSSQGCKIPQAPPCKPPSQPFHPPQPPRPAAPGRIQQHGSLSSIPLHLSSSSQLLPSPGFRPSPSLVPRHCNSTDIHSHSGPHMVANTQNGTAPPRCLPTQPHFSTLSRFCLPSHPSISGHFNCPGSPP